MENIWNFNAYSTQLSVFFEKHGVFVWRSVWVKEEYIYYGFYSVFCGTLVKCFKKIKVTFNLFDLTKAFDFVSYNKLISELGYYWIRKCSFKIIKTNLSQG